MYRYRVYQAVLSHHIRNCVGVSLTILEIAGLTGLCDHRQRIHEVLPKKIFGFINFLFLRREKKICFNSFYLLSLIVKILTAEVGRSIYFYWVLQRGHGS